MGNYKKAKYIFCGGCCRTYGKLKELSKNLKGYDLEEFVADLLKAMGYRTKVSPHGGDSGIDIVAYKDELPPRTMVQV
ncbi:restriction endonuclease [Hungatella sp.]|uniref:restriction endonuclease n=1 Tax=Hungatella sp. TaxID=2613924 RepID=UPI002A816DE5|nr:restriction endonuclease [Hungatella sp.]